MVVADLPLPHDVSGMVHEVSECAGFVQRALRREHLVLLLERAMTCCEPFGACFSGMTGCWALPLLDDGWKGATSSRQEYLVCLYFILLNWYQVSLSQSSLVTFVG
jgi:hypothetical protein